MNDVTVFYGNYGSGKTELALNLALALARRHRDVTLVDLDIVNPYFRSSEHRAMLEQKGIRVIAPVYANTAVDLPALPPDILAAFKGGHAVFDCGGDPVGASALGGLAPHFDAVRARTQALFVVNTMRPFQRSAGEIAQSMQRIEAGARLKTDGFVLNSNLGAETTGEELVQGYAILKTLAEKAGVPIKFISGTPAALDFFTKRCPDHDGELFSICVMMRPEWL